MRKVTCYECEKRYDYDDDGGRDLLLVTYGRTFDAVRQVCAARRADGQATSVGKLNRVLPLPQEVVTLATAYRCVLVLEESCGGVSDLLGSALLQSGYTGRYGVRAITDTPGVCTTEQGLQAAGLDITGISVRQINGCTYCTSITGTYHCDSHSFISCTPKVCTRTFS